MKELQLYVAGIGVWSRHLADIPALSSWLAGSPAAFPAARAPAAMLPANERRRAPENVLIAAEVAGQAIGMSGLDPATLSCVFSSSHGDQAVTDYMCQTLAEAPLALSPTRFHNSVHNAAAGYWTIATGCRAPSTALCAEQASVGAGLLEAAALANCDDQAVLLVCSDTAGQGPLLELTACRQPFAAAMILCPTPPPRPLARLKLNLGDDSTAATTLERLPKDWLGDNPAAASLALLASMLTGGGRCTLAAAEGLQLIIDVEIPA